MYVVIGRSNQCGTFWYSISSEQTAAQIEYEALKKGLQQVGYLPLLAWRKEGSLEEDRPSFWRNIHVLELFLQAQGTPQEEEAAEALLTCLSKRPLLAASFFFRPDDQSYTALLLLKEAPGA